MRRAFLVASALAIGSPAAAADFASAFYDPLTDQIVVDIDYRGTHAAHDFQLRWGP